MSSKTRTVVVLSAIVLCASVDFVAADETQQKSGALRIEEQKLDVGEFQAGTEVVGTFVFHNDGERDIKIIRAKPS